MPLPLTTERLLMRPATPDDLDAWHAISRDAEEAWFGTPSSALADARANLEKHMAHHERHRFGLCAAELRATRDVIGVAGLTHLSDGPEIEVGYRFLKKHWGNGYATEAASASIEFGLDELRLAQIVAVTLPSNRASRNVMEKCGMTHVGVMHVYGFEQVKYAIAR